MVSRSIVVMGVAGSGKSTIGKLLSGALGAEFADGDDLHSPENKAKMAAGTALGDAERMPWLAAVGERLSQAREAGSGIVLACSALKHSYRDILRSYSDDVFLVFLDGPQDLIRQRLEARDHEFMPPALLTSQFSILEPPAVDEAGIRVDVRHSPEVIVDEILSALAPHAGAAAGR